MKFSSTRSAGASHTFEEVVMKGLADDGGLFVPAEIPQLAVGDLFNEDGTALTFQDIPRETLKEIIHDSYTKFRVPSAVVLEPVGNFHVLVELFHGPTYSFKDVALQFLGNLFQFFLQRNNDAKESQGKPKSIKVVGATSGDTGSAAIHGLRGKKHVQVFIMYPSGRVSPIQEQQMATVDDKNVHNLSVKGTFDDCQAVVKGLFNDLEFKSNYIDLVSKKRIPNPKTKKSNEELSEVSFSVPTGNFGDILAGFYAKKMGLPVKHLICATNSNNILHNFFSKGIYQSPSMDIQVASNFERFLYFLSGNNPETVREWMSTFDTCGAISVSTSLLGKANQDIVSADCDKQETLNAIKQIFTKYKYPICPHTAAGVVAALKYYPNLLSAPSEVPLVCLATAHHSKFGDAVELALGQALPLPQELSDLSTLPLYKTEIGESLSTSTEKDSVQHIKNLQKIVKEFIVDDLLKN